MSAISMTGGQALVQALIEHGVDIVFGIPGIQLDPLYDALFARRNELRVVHTRHEQGAAFMAMGYAQASDRTGVFAVVPGPGLLNAMAAVSTAVAANAPVLGLTGQIPSYQIGRGFGMAHELRDQMAMSEGVVEWVRRANHPNEVPGLIQAAFDAMHGARKKPAILEMAPDQLAAMAPVKVLKAQPPPPGPIPDPQKLEKMAERLASARSPAIFVGGGVFGAETSLKCLAERLQAPVIASVSGRGALSDDHPLSFDILSGQDIWQDVDTALVVGTRFTAPALAWGRFDAMEVLRIDVDPVQIAKPMTADLALVAHAKDALPALVEALGPGSVTRNDYLERCTHARREVRSKLSQLGPLPVLASGLRAALPRDGVIVNDVTQLGSFLRYGADVYEPRTMLGPGYQATLGYGLPAALGAKLARPQRKVVAVCGDGGFMFTVQELATAIHHQIAVVVVVLDNASYGNVKTIQDENFGGRNIAVSLSNPDFVAMAKAFGIQAARVDQPESFQGVLEHMLSIDAPTLIHVPIPQVPSIWKLIRRPPSQGRVGG